VGDKQDFAEVEMSAIREFLDKVGPCSSEGVYLASAMKEIADRLDALDKVSAKQSELNEELVATIEQLAQQAHVHAVSQSPVEQPELSAKPERECIACVHDYRGDGCSCDDISCVGFSSFEPKQPKPSAGDDTLLDFQFTVENFQFTVKKYNEALTKVIKQRDELKAQVAELTVEKEQMHKMYEDAVAKRGEQ